MGNTPVRSDPTRPISIASAAYLNGPGGLVKNLSTSSYYYQDASGSTSHLANASGALVEWYRYDLHGTPIFYNASNTQISGSNYGIRHLFTGQQWYSDIGVYDLRNRFYSPDIGRFLQPDPISFAGDATNLYRYCANNPLKFSDPQGTVFGEGPWIFGFGGAVAGFVESTTVQLVNYASGGTFNWTEVGITTAAGFAGGYFMGAVLDPDPISLTEAALGGIVTGYTAAAVRVTANTVIAANSMTVTGVYETPNGGVATNFSDGSTSYNFGSNGFGSYDSNGDGYYIWDPTGDPGSVIGQTTDGVPIIQQSANASPGPQANPADSAVGGPPLPPVKYL